MRGRLCGRICAPLAIVALFLALAAPTHAVEPGEMLRDHGLEARARTISAGLRCLVCQNESIDDSHAELAQDIRMLVRQRLLAGDSDRQVSDYLVARYGQFILLRPPVEGQTLLLWGMPLLVLGLGGAGVWRVYRRTRTALPEPAAQLTPIERRRLEELCSGPAGPSPT